jgi:glutathione S-transferase
MRKVVLVLEHKRIPYEQEPLSPVVNPSEEFLRISPLRKIPVRVWATPLFSAQFARERAAHLALFPRET